MCGCSVDGVEEADIEESSMACERERDDSEADMLHLLGEEDDGQLGGDGTILRTVEEHRWRECELRQAASCTLVALQPHAQHRKARCGVVVGERVISDESLYVTNNMSSSLLTASFVCKPAVVLHFG